jgi:hypothetical protein
LGQDADLLAQIERHAAHPAMAGYGLWSAEDDLDSLVDEIYQARQAAPRRSTADL